MTPLPSLPPLDEAINFIDIFQPFLCQKRACEKWPSGLMGLKGTPQLATPAHILPAESCMHRMCSFRFLLFIFIFYFPIEGPFTWMGDRKMPYSGFCKWCACHFSFFLLTWFLRVTHSPAYQLLHCRLVLHQRPGYRRPSRPTDTPLFAACGLMYRTHLQYEVAQRTLARV